ncbi:TrkA family potassium uptake protein [candidate division WOR-3 bacterium]|nr:TrkA family potassium uptake protein [candidate division WOR-3 bacterium]
MIGKQKNEQRRRKDFVVVGLGAFGITLSKALIEKGCHVTAIDMDEKLIESISDFAIDVLIADARDRKPLEEAGVANVDAAIVSVGEDLESSFLATLHLKEFGIPYIITKATSKSQGEILEKIGADRVIYPEEEMAEKLAEQLIHPSIINYTTLSKEVGIMESATPQKFIGKTLKELSLRNKYGINIIAIKRKKEKKDDVNTVEEVLEVPSADEKIREGDILIVIGHVDYLEKFKNMERENNGTE